MTAETVISAQNVTLSVPVVRSDDRRLMARPFSTLAEFYRATVAEFYHRARRSRHLKTILRNLTFDLRSGDRVAIVGANGAGKTSLLRILAGVLQPTTGKLTINGSCQALLDLHGGMQEAATGLQNIYLCGLALGLSLSEIRERAADIVQFTELGDVIHDPLSTYSSGMQARVAFAAATAVRSRTLLLDEWIGTGDIQFMSKAKERLVNRIDCSEVVVLATHDEGILREICNRALVLKEGTIVCDCDVDEALAYYRGDEYWKGLERDY